MISGRTAQAFALTLCLLATVACTRQVRTAAYTPTPISNVNVMVARQIKNAADAGDGDTELRRLRQRLAENPKDLEIRILLARRYAQQGLPDLALEHYRLAAAQFPESAVVAMALAKTLREMGAPVEALHAVREYVERQPRGSWEAVSLAGILEDEQGQYAAAEVSHRAAVALAPDQSSLHNNLGYNLLTQGRKDAAVEEFRRAIQLDPKSEIAHNNLGAALAAQSGAAPNEALTELRRSASQAEAHNNVAAVLIEGHRYAEARAELQIALKYQPGLPAAVANLRLVSEMDGKPFTPEALAQPAKPARRSLKFWSWMFVKKSTVKTVAAQAAPSVQPGADSEEAAVKK